MLNRARLLLKKLFSISLIFTLLPILAIQVANPQVAAAAACATGAAAQNNIEVEPSHGKVLYIDTGVSPRIDGAYIGYRVTNTTGSSISGWWVSLTNFKGGVVSLANSRDQYMQLPTIANGSTGTVYFLVKASSSTKVSQTHTVTVYNGKPDVSASSSRYSCDFSFTKVAETIKAAANKITSITSSGNMATGQLITVIAEGATGTIGAGSSDVGRILWFSPTAFSNFPTGALRLESVTLKVSDNNQISTNGSNKSWLFKERLLVTTSTTPDSDSGLLSGGETSADTLVGKRYYQNTYKFRVLNQTSSATVIQPIAQISSGTQIKHTDLSAAGSSLSLSTNSVATSLTVTKSVTSTSGLATASCGGSTCNVVPYRIRLSSSSGTITVDEVVDTPASGVTYKSGSVSISSGSISEPVQLTSESSLSPQPYHFLGPFTVTAGTNLDISYQMLVPQTANATYVNTAVAYIGTQQIGASNSTFSNVTVTNNSSGGVSSAVSSTTTISPVATTYGATSIGTTSATLNGTIDGNSQTPSAQFEWSTNSNLSTYTTVSLSAVSGSDPVAFTSTFTGTSGTTYYYRIVAVKSGTRYAGDIFSFTLIEATSTPTASTTVATSILTRSATLNGSIDPNMQTISEVRFVYGTDSQLSGATSKILKELDEAGAETSTNVTLTGANPIDLSYVIPADTLSTNTVYYFRIEGTYSSGPVEGSILSFKTGTTAQTITFGDISSKAFSASTYTASATASSGLAVTYNSESTSICTVNSSTGVVTFVAAGFCVITASQSGSSTYAPAEPVTQQFEITPSAPTATTQSATSVGRTSTTLNGSVTTGGGGSTTTSFVYGTDSNLSSGNTTVTATESPRTSDGSGSYSLSGLTPNTTYYFKITGTNSTGSASGTILSFTTLPLTAITLTADNKSKNYGESTPAFTFSLTSGSMNNTDTVTALTYRFTRVSPSYDSSTAPTNAGSYTITISAATVSNNATDDYSITYATGTYTINKVNQATLSLADRTMSQATTYTISATGGSGTGAITYSESSETFATGNCTIASTDQLTTPAENGTCTITATKAADDNYNSASTSGVMTVNNYLSQTITFNIITDRNFSATPFSHSTISSDSTLDVTLTSNSTSICTVNTPHNSGTTPTITMLSAGTCSLTASQSGGTVGSNSYNAASSVTRTFVISKLPQIITFPAITDKQVGDSDENLPAKTDADINISYTTNDSSICTIVGSAGSYKIHVVAAGTCTVTSSAASTSIYLDATNVTRTFNIIAASGGGGGGGSPAPVYVPKPPTITSISAPEVCAISSQLVIKGTWLSGATAKVDGVSAQVLASSSNEMTIKLPSAAVGTKTITVSNTDGSATTTIKYAFADTPIYVDYIYPETFKDRFFSYVFKAIDAVKYEISGVMPAGLVLNPLTGELSGAPTQEGNFVFQIVASNICASTPLIVYMFVDKAIPTAFTCSVAFNVPSSNNITETKLTNLRNCLSKTSTLSPKYINPVIFISGGLPAGLTSDQALTHPRYLPILDLIVSMNLNAQIYYGAFNGSTDSVQLNVYWPDPS